NANDFLLPENKQLVLDFVNEAYHHCKALYFGPGTRDIYIDSHVSKKKHEDPAVITEGVPEAADKFIQAVSQHRVWHLEIE
ncbi:catalase HPII, partial [Chryseobacterium sp. SIMBA_038]